MQIHRDINVLVLIKRPDNERYVWLYRDSHKSEILHSIWQFAARDDLSLTWKDAGVLTTRVHNLKPGKGIND